MGKNIVVCLDGTGNQVKATGGTNVVRLYEMLDLSDPSRQVAYYDPGVGTFSSQGAWTPAGRRLSKLFGLAFGTGMRQNLGEAYTFLMQCYQPGDSIYLFGFSRGAYTARALAGMLYRIGVMRPGCENLVQYAVNEYARNKQQWQDDDWHQIDRFSSAFAIRHRLGGRESRAVPVEFLGVWDSVKAAGFLGWELKWPYTRQLPNAKSVWHAVSIDEHRRPYREYLVEPRGDRPALTEVWFAGVHSDVGGTFDDDPRLATIGLKWMTDGAVAAGLQVLPRRYAGNCAVSPDHSVGTIHRMGRVWALLGHRTRPLPPGARVHCSVRTRIAGDADYGKRLPGDALWEDEKWLIPTV